MKKLYDGLMLEVVDFDAEDVITTSGQDGCPTQAEDCPCQAQKEGGITCPSEIYCATVQTKEG